MNYCNQIKLEFKVTYNVNLTQLLEVMMTLMWKLCWITTAIALSPALWQSAPVTAQSIPITAATDGTGTIVLQNGQRFNITGGTQAGANLFHSFQQFGLNQGQIANFLSQPNIQNILSRVVGGDPSVINGLIQLTGGNSNLYIMNPAGIIFGANASLNVPASFNATTANGIQVGNGWFGINTSASDLQNLVGTPNAFAFTSSPMALTQGQTSGVILNQGSLNVSQGKSISLVGGIVINTGSSSTTDGTINIVAVPDGKYVRITPEGGVLSFDLPIATQQELGNAKPMMGIDLPKLLAGTPIATPTQSGTAIAAGNLSAASINILANRYDSTQASLNAKNIQQGWNFVFIDSTIKDYQTLLDGTNGGSSVTVINLDQFGIQKVTDTLASVTGANSLHIVSEGDAGNFWLGKDFVSTKNIAKYANDLQAWKTSLSPAANILLYACNLASGENGSALVQAVKNYTGHDVAASINRTGSVALGGDWNLEYQTGKNPTTVIFNDAATQAYTGDLALFTVTNNANGGAGSLRTQIASANGAAGADTIRFDTTGIFATPQTITLTSGLLPTITQDLTIQGTGASNLTISGNNASGVFRITSGNITIDGLTIANGNTAVNGGGISNASPATLVLTNSIVSNNLSNSNGSGIYNTGTMTISNSNISGNTATNNGGGVYNTGNMTISNSNISGNTATNNGGGVYNTGNMTISNSTISGNTATTNGGGVFTTIGAIAISNSTISGNRVDFGGGVLVNSGTATFTNITVSGNAANRDGGGIYHSNGNVTITNSTITNNKSDADNNNTGNGGGIFRNNAAITTTIRNSIIAGNFDTAGSGAINLDVRGTFVDGGNNLIGSNNGSTDFTVSTLVGTNANPIDPKLAPLGNYGGVTQTHALLLGSPALNAGNNSFVAGIDQRGLPRISGGTVDIGAFEFQVPDTTVPAVTTAPNVTTASKSSGFGGVFPSRENLERFSSRLDEQELQDISFTQVLCLDNSLAIAQTTSIPTCKKP
jgi:filamentous hemagglutinin family protein